ncbi:hypothetical protein FIBSPDRAFT_1045343 [Athelia psychrophila]|uniref:Hydrophobin n=1 Tax=Athelia psychrophila TaxID=1759441 RepID=A0A166IFD8_9AGAM|nr:hypothetical protein FIBSPDRAFT_1045343 [Fibularhizoctonia sp. CBS 109695]
MQFSKPTFFVAAAVAASFVAAAPSSADQIALTPCLGLIQPCTTNAACCSNKFASKFCILLLGPPVLTILVSHPLQELIDDSITHLDL